MSSQLPPLSPTWPKPLPASRAIASVSAEMRTSRLSQETSKALSALASPTSPLRTARNSSPPSTARRRSTRQFAHSLKAFAATNGHGDGVHVKLEDGDDSRLSSSSSAAASSGDDWEAESEPEREPSRKRKRGADKPTGKAKDGRTANGAGVKQERSPRKGSRKGKTQPAQRSGGAAGQETTTAPFGWEEMYETMKEVRESIVAPVDTMGCERLADPNVSERDQRFQTLISLLLSSQTKDTTNAIAMANLKAGLPPPGLTLENILAVDPVKLNEMIFPVGFHNNKTKYMKALAPMLRDQWGGDIPDTLEGLLALPGIGSKMAFLCLSAAWGKDEGIGVDVHVHRITNLWRWHKTKMPEETRKTLEGWLPREKWHEINTLMVGFGQTVCTPVGRKCGECRLAEKRICPAAVVGKKVKAKREVKIEDGESPVVKMEIKEEAVEENVTLGDIEDLATSSRSHRSRR